MDKKLYQKLIKCIELGQILLKFDQNILKIIKSV